MWPLLLKGLSKLIKQNLHLELIGCIHLENWRDPKDDGCVLCFYIEVLHCQKDALMTSCDKSVKNKGTSLEHKNVKLNIWKLLWMRWCEK